MRWASRLRVGRGPFFFVAAIGFSCAAAASEGVPGSIRLQLATDLASVRVTASAAINVTGGSAFDLFPAGIYTVTVAKPIAAQDRYHLFSKTFQLDEEGEETAYLAEWTAKGYSPESVELGRRYTTASGAIADNRIHWISLARFASEAEALATQKALQSESVWAWVRREQTAIGAGEATLSDSSGKALWHGAIPVSVASEEPLAVTIDGADRSYAGTLEVRVEQNGNLGLYESTGLEDYIAGVLPAEMPALWPIEALKAQAIAARSDVLAHMNLKHGLEGFDYTTNESNRVYTGFGGRHPNTDQAVAQTRGEVITQGGRIVPAVFSATCGGYSEDNDSVWSAPPDPMLRARADFPDNANPVPNGPVAYGLDKWLRSRPNAYCAGDEKYFRWTRTLTVAEVSAAVNKVEKVGTVTSISLGERGPGGRLKSVKVTGSSGSATIFKEFPIRQAFGGLPSAMFIVDTSSTGQQAKSFTFTGGGRGHGVGLCQYGARGMASQGADSHRILTHYYSRVAIERVE